MTRDETIKRTIGANLRRVIERNGMSITEAAAEIGTKRGTVSSWCNGRTTMTMMSLIDTCCALGCSADELLGLEIK